MSDLILRLALPSPLRRLFDYRAPRGIPRSALQPGIRLLLPFGRRELVGVLIDVTDRSEVPEDKLKPALRVLDAKPPMPAHLLELCRWTAQYYQHSLGDTLSWALPNLLRQGRPAERASSASGMPPRNPASTIRAWPGRRASARPWRFSSSIRTGCPMSC